MPDWKKAYDDLKAFIAKNPNIELTPGVISIPADARGEFYRLFDAVRMSIIMDDFPEMIEKGSLLSQEWIALSGKAIVDYQIKEIELDPGTNWFLQDPQDGLMRLLFDPLFDVIRGKQDFISFEKSVPDLMKSGFCKFMNDGYLMWTTLSLLRLLATDKIYAVEKSEFDKDPSAHIELAVAGVEENVPDAKEADTISFKHTLKYSFLVPNVIGHSQRLNSFISFVPDFEYNEAKWRGRNLDPYRKWYEISDIIGEFGQSRLWPDVAIYAGEHWKNLVVAADDTRMGQPDLILELKVEKDWYENEGLDLIRRHYNVLKPKFGTFVVCLDKIPAAAFQELVPKPEREPKPVVAVPNSAPVVPMEPAEAEVPAPDIHLLDVGYDVNKLQPLVEAILRTQKATG